MFSYLFLKKGNTDSDNQEEDDTSPQPKRQCLGRKILYIIILNKLLTFPFLNLMLILELAKYVLVRYDSSLILGMRQNVCMNKSFQHHY